MHLNHVHLAGPDVAALEDFYSRWFGFRRRASHDDITFLVDGAGFLLAIDAVAETPVFPKWFHLGFCQDSPHLVRDLFAKMKAGGVRFTRELTEYDGDATVFFCLDPAGTKVEVSWHKD
jgi:catechol 2,3-dioxygenase-like lactoylglutathione lyase family enzyme